MPQEEDTTARLIQFFTLHPELVPKLSDEPSHVEIWEEIFHHFFGEYPKDNPEIERPSYWRKGSTDPRWDILLFKERLGAMRAVRQILDDWREKRVAFPPHKEAA